jgi:hypothetical protein
MPQQRQDHVDPELGPETDLDGNPERRHENGDQKGQKILGIHVFHKSPPC